MLKYQIAGNFRKDKRGFPRGGIFPHKKKMTKKLLKIIPLVLAVVMCAFILSACVDADFEVQKEKMTEKGYYCNEITYEASASRAFNFSKMNPAGTAHETVTIIYYSTDSDAIVKGARFAGYSLGTLPPELAETYTYAIVGKIFIHGTQKAVEDALS